MKNLIVANWKMNPNSQKEAKEIFDAIRDGARGLKAEVVVCPPSVVLSVEPKLRIAILFYIFITLLI